MKVSNSLDPDQARLIWVQTVSKVYQQATLDNKELILFDHHHTPNVTIKFIVAGLDSEKS